MQRITLINLRHFKFLQLLFAYEHRELLIIELITIQCHMTAIDPRRRYPERDVHMGRRRTQATAAEHQHSGQPRQACRCCGSGRVWQVVVDIGYTWAYE